MEWRLIPGFEGYRVSDTGSIQSLWKKSGGSNSYLTDTWNDIKQFLDTRGYFIATIRQSRGVRVSRGIHKLVLLAFVGPRPHGQVCRHKDGNPKNNNLDNLQYGTQKENQHDSLLHGTRVMGSRHHSARLSQTDVNDIRASDLSDQHLSEKYGVNTNHIINIRTCRRWNDGGRIALVRRERRYKLTDEQITEIKQSPVSTVRLARIYGVSQPYVSQVKRGLVPLSKDRIPRVPKCV